MKHSRTNWKITFDEASSNHYIGKAESEHGQRIQISGGSLTDVLKDLVGEIVEDYEQQIIKSSIKRRDFNGVLSESLEPIVTIQIDLSLSQKFS